MVLHNKIRIVGNVYGTFARIDLCLQKYFIFRGVYDKMTMLVIIGLKFNFLYRSEDEKQTKTNENISFGFNIVNGAQRLW